MSNYSEALSSAAGYCSLAEHCISEVLDRIKKFELASEEQSKLIDHLKSEGYLNEQRYCKAFAKDKFRFGKWGRNKIRYTLRQKGIPSVLIEEGIAEINEDDYVDLLIDLLQQKKKSAKAKTDYELRGKLIRFAAGKGFELDLAQTCLQKLGIRDED